MNRVISTPDRTRTCNPLRDGQLFRQLNYGSVIIFNKFTKSKNKKKPDCFKVGFHKKRKKGNNYPTEHNNPSSNNNKSLNMNTKMSDKFFIYIFLILIISNSKYTAKLKKFY